MNIDRKIEEFEKKDANPGTGICPKYGTTKR